VTLGEVTVLGDLPRCGEDLPGMEGTSQVVGGRGGVKPGVGGPIGYGENQSGGGEGEQARCGRTQPGGGNPPDMEGNRHGGTH
jgi:hypothetical protein